MPDFEFEANLWKKGFRAVAGADEVGRGAWAGPVVAAAVAFAPISNFKFKISFSLKIDDSKKLSVGQREKAEVWIKKNALAWGIGEVGATVINTVGLTKASRMAFRRAIANCNHRLQTTVYSLRQNKKAVVRSQSIVDFLLIDAFYLPYTRGLKRKNQQAIIKGDTKSRSIAAASIIAKVYRDRLMSKLGRQHSEYGWIRNKGYGTREHQEAILKHGLTRLHRKQYVKRLLSF